MLTKIGKIFAVSSFDGTILWTFYEPTEKVVKVFVEQSAGYDNQLDIIVVTEKDELHLDPVTGTVRSKHHHEIDTFSY